MIGNDKPAKDRRPHRRSSLLLTHERKAMEPERAIEITAACVKSAMSRILGESERDYVPLPDVSLEEMLVANRMVEEMNRTAHESRDADGGYQIRMMVDPRGIAAQYAFECY